MVKISIICTNYNKKPWIAEAIQSFLNQKCQFDYEIILVDDASTDGSDLIIRDYAEKYPDRIKAFFNKTNKGITATWISVCKEVSGDYIARCDGDDYWTDSEKLQKQINLLESNQESKWSCTDFDIISESGQLLHTKAIKNGIIRKMSSFEEELAYKGMTMSSSWLVETQLMKEVNDLIAPDAVDDTFNLQLELFNKTKLSFLEDSTVVYRLHDGSDSHPLSVEKAKQRFERLKETQLEYLQKNASADTALISSYLISEVSEQEKIIYEQRNQINKNSQLIQDLETNKSQLEKNIEQLRQEMDELEHKRDFWLNEYNMVVNSRRWKIPTKVINFFRRK
ncbi:glycosyltransferase [Streptococcus sp. HF-1907]|uniref:glycosyltransferase n=1 Tax=Streptococcus sp. HF-1907 TaxID=2785793 RepID=UPI00189D7043|nr:glycosyltransferase [Streptococcus sp. HF-1907]MBF7095186.1 glycosyltransferase [Streptococcus sp. HF-1907]